MNLNIDNNNIEEYILEISSNNMKSLEKLYDSTRNSVYGFAFSILKNTSDAEDVMQDTYVNIYRYASMYNPRNKPLAWILTIVRNLCLEKLKKKKRTINTSIEDIDKILSSNSKDNNYDIVLFQTILELLSEEERQIIMLSSIDGFKYREIAALLNLNLSTVLSKYHRAIRKIRSKYKEV